MDDTRYLEERLEQQQEWYSRQSAWNQQWHKRLRIAGIVAGALIPVLVGLLSGHWFLKLVVAVLGAGTVVISGIMAVYRFQELWTEYRATSEALKHEKYLYMAHCPPYDENDAFETVVRRTEALISSEHSRWIEVAADRKRPPSV